MRKTYPYMVAIIVAVGMLWFVKTGRADNTNVVATNTIPSATPTPTPSPVASSTPGAAPTDATPTPAATPNPTTSKTGDSVDTPYGPVQVEAVFTSGKLTNIKVLQVPDQSSRDQQIASYALPQLKSEALSAQSTNIDAISGATFTSEGYIQSLQTALSS